MATMNMIQAINSAMDVMLARDPDVVIFGEDVGYFGGVFRATEGLQKKHGLERCFDTPISESTIAGATCNYRKTPIRILKAGGSGRHKMAVGGSSPLEGPCIQSIS